MSSEDSSLNVGAERKLPVGAERKLPVGTERKLPVATMASFGIGEAAYGFMHMGWSVLLLFFYQQVVGVEAALVGLAIAIAVTVDGITDPLIGMWSDRIHSRWGRRHPMLMIAAVPYAVSFVLLFRPPDDLSNVQGFLWLLTFAVLTRTSFTFYNIPHLALGAEMAHDYDQRSTLFAYSSFIGTMSVAVAYGLITGYYFPTTSEYDPGFLNPAGYPRMSTTFAIVMAISILLCVIGTRREIPHLRTTQSRTRVHWKSGFAELATVFRNRSFRAVFCGAILGSIVQGVESTFTPFMGVHFWGFRTEDLFYLAYVGFFAFPISFLLIPRLTRWFDKRYAVIVAHSCWIVAVNIPICLRLLGVPWFPNNDSPWVLRIFLLTSTIGALAAPIIGATINSMLADVADEEELDTGVRREGVIYSMRAFSLKATAAMGTLIGGVLLSLIDFPRSATRGDVDPDTVWRLGLIAGPATSVFALAALGFYLLYNIDRRRHQAIVTELEARKDKPPLAER